jgi:nicotinamide-nucleotide amidase
MQSNSYMLNLAEQLGNDLKTRGLKLALAESCTGGMLAQSITAIAGSSAWFDCGFVTYSNQAKIGILKVLSSSLETHGAVSEQVAREMAQGCLKVSQAHTSVSITGIAGPDGGTQTKPVGTVCFGFATANQTQACTQHFAGDRESVRQQSVVFALTKLIEMVSQTSTIL